ncbi:MAG: extracellular solute-binding protein [Parvibaculaceae bacterium]
MRLDRRLMLKLAGALGLAGGFRIVGAGVAHAEEKQWRHGLSLFGELKYAEGFKQFDYVNAQAPKGGKLRYASVGTFDSLNPFIIKGVPAAGLSFIYDTLMTSSYDEASTEYGLIVERVSHPDDFSSVTFQLRDSGRWHDGQPITPEDVIFSFEFLKESHPRYRFYYRNVTKAEKTGDREVTFTFDTTGNRELPQIMGQLFILPKHYWEGTGQDGKAQDINQTTLTPPLGSGAYRIKTVKPGQSISYERVEDYWGKDLPVNVGTNNFDEIEIIYFRDRTVIFEAFKGDQVDVRTGGGTKEWDQQYDFPAYKNGSVIKSSFLTKNAEPMQAFVLNTRRPKFADARVRRAFNLAYDFEGQNRLLSFGNYNKRTGSFFANSELAATGLPQGIELQILEEVRDGVPPEVFTTAYENPVNGSPQNIRKNLREALDLLNAAGWSLVNRALTHKETGERMTAEFLLNDPGFEDIVLYYKQTLDRLGIEIRVRTVDSSQYQNRVQNFDFDVITDVWQQSLSPGNEQREYWGSAAADRPGSQNTIGIKDPAIDKIIDRIIFAKDRETLVAASRALDRVLLWHHYVVPQFFRPEVWIGHWNRFGFPTPPPPYNPGYPSLWWWDKEKAAKVKRA